MTKTIKIQDHYFEPYIGADAIHEAITRIANQINIDYADCDSPLLMITLSGGVVFGGELFRQIQGNCEIGFVKLSSYLDALCSTGVVMADIPPTHDVTGRDIIIVEDMVDTGTTIEKLISMFTQARANSIRIASLLIKRDVYKKHYPIDYVGLECENSFVVGYGLDYAGQGRNLDRIFKIVE